MLRLQHGCRRALLVACSAAAFRLPQSCDTLGAALDAAQAAFEGASVPEPRLSAEHLLTSAAGCSGRGTLSLQLREPLLSEVRTTFEGMCVQRLRRVPVQYIVGDWDFHELTLLMRPPTLIPRPETEELVEHVLAAHAEPADRPMRILDVGCGTGAIGLALVNKLRRARCDVGGGSLSVPASAPAPPVPTVCA